MRELEFCIDDADSGIMIKDYLRNFGFSSALIRKLKKEPSLVLLNGSPAKCIDKLNAFDTLKITIKSSGAMPKPYRRDDVEVMYNDEDIIVLNKPCGMPVHESRNHIGDTLANVAACYMDSDTAFRAVYRLDRDTSGLVLIAKNELCASKLAGKIKKDYYAVCDGVIENDGTIDLPIRRVKESIIERGVFDDGERAITHYQVIKTNGKNTLLKINLETGKTHQIRVHFSHLNHALTGDSLYGGDCSKINRQALHCKTIYFTHPVSNNDICVDCDFPEDFKGLI